MCFLLGLAIVGLCYYDFAIIGLACYALMGLKFASTCDSYLTVSTVQIIMIKLIMF
jgi:hypothetical protein